MIITTAPSTICMFCLSEAETEQALGPGGLERLCRECLEDLPHCTHCGIALREAGDECERVPVHVCGYVACIQAHSRECDCLLEELE